MREIKFRAWDKMNKKMLKVVEIDFFRRKMYFTIDNKYYGECSLDDVILMQYTGLKDKNNKEIYEGDILSIEIKDKTIKGKIIASGNTVVEYKDCKFGVVWGWHRDFTGLDGFYNTTFEVIGNVYEDPKLLQEDKHEEK